MKKIRILALSVIMTLLISTTAFAGEINQDSSSNTTDIKITYTVNPTYTITIPSSVTLGESAEIKAENVVLLKGKMITVKPTATSGTDNAFTVKTTEGAEIEYSITKSSSNVAIGDTILSVNPTTAASGNSTLNFIVPSNIKYAGTYTGTVTFTVAVENE